jgi:hypothetical protein
MFKNILITTLLFFVTTSVYSFDSLLSSDEFFSSSKVKKTKHLLDQIDVGFLFDENNTMFLCNEDSKMFFYRGFFSIKDKSIIICNKGSKDYITDRVLTHELVHVAQWCGSNRTMFYTLGTNIPFEEMDNQLKRPDVDSISRLMIEAEAETISKTYSFDDVLSLVEEKCK